MSGPKTTLAKALMTTGLLTHFEVGAARATTDLELSQWIAGKALLPAKLVNQALAGENLVIGRYRVTGRIGVGGMGAVLRAEDPNLGRAVALKVLPQDAKKEDLDRFRREAKALAALNHPNVVRIYSFEVMDGVAFLVMQLVDGESLEERLSDTTLDEDEAWGLLTQAVDALADAESHSILHRDVKPGNILCGRDGDRVVYKLCDFGLARFQSEPQGHVTQKGYAMGTPAYMSPEQARGDDVDVRSDMYALGMTLHQALTGKIPFEEPGRGIAVLLTKRLTEDVPDVRKARPETSTLLAHLLARLVARERCGRPKSWAALKTELRERHRKQVRAAVSESAARGAPQTEVDAPGSRRNLVAAGIAGVAVALVVVVSALDFGGAELDDLPSVTPPPPVVVDLRPVEEPPDPAPPDEAPPPAEETPPAEKAPPPPTEETPSLPPPDEPLDPVEVPVVVEPVPPEHDPAERIVDAAGLASAKALAKAGNAAAAFRVAEWLTAKRNAQEAAPWLKRAAEASHPGGMHLWAVALNNGYGVERDRADAFVWMKKAADAGQPAAMGEYGTMLTLGLGVERDLALGVAWYRKAAEAGNGWAMSNLAWAHENGEGAAQDDALADVWYRKSAATGNALGAENLERWERLAHVDVDPRWKNANPQRQPRRGLKKGGSTKTERAVAGALDWLVRHQEDDGRWYASGWGSRCTPGAPCAGVGTNAGEERFTSGLTALSVLAFLGQGDTHLSGPHKPRVRRALRWLLGLQDEHGFVGFDPARGDTIYNHVLATLVLCEAYGLTGDRQLAGPAQAALTACLDAQEPGLGWKYGIKTGKSDTSVTGWMVQALVAGREAGFDVPDKAFAGARSWLEGATDSVGRSGYESPGGGSSFLKVNRGKFERLPVMTAAALLGLTGCGVRKAEPLLKKQTKILQGSLPKGNPSQINFYYWYYGSYALFQRGPTAFRKWNKALKGVLVSAQHSKGCDAGSWPAVGEWCPLGGRVYAVAINALTLEVYYRRRR